MIQVIEGKGVGSGKSYFVIDLLVQHWRRGGTAFVSESFSVVWSECCRLVADRYGVVLEVDQFHEVKSEDVARLHEVTPPGTEECPVLIILDEAQDQLNARDWNDTSKRALFQWACQSRHDDNDLVFVSQSAANIDKQIRRLATFTWSIRNSRNFSIPGIGNVASNIRLLTLGLNNGFYFIRNQLDYDGRTVLERRWIKADKGLFRCYKSKSMRQAKKRLGAPVGKRKLAKIKGRSNMIKWAIIFVLGVACFAAWSVFRTGMFREKTKPVGAPVAASAAAGTPGAAVAARHVGEPAPMATPGYEVRRESFLGRLGQTLITEAGEYTVGEISPSGMVQGIRGNVARVVTPSGGLLYIVADHRTGERKPAPVMPTPKPKSTEIIIAGDNPRPGIVNPSGGNVPSSK